MPAHVLPAAVDAALIRLHNSPSALKRLRRLPAGLVGPYRCEQDSALWPTVAWPPSQDPSALGPHGTGWSVAGRLSWHQACAGSGLLHHDLRDTLLAQAPQAMAWAPGRPEAYQDALWIWAAAVLRDDRDPPPANRVTGAQIASHLLQGDGPARAERVQAMGRALARAIVARHLANRLPPSDARIARETTPLRSFHIALDRLSPQPSLAPLPAGPVASMVMVALPDPSESLACMGQALYAWSRLLEGGAPRLSPVKTQAGPAWHAWMAPQVDAWVQGIDHALQLVSRGFRPPKGVAGWTAQALDRVLSSGHGAALEALGGAQAVLDRLDTTTTLHLTTAYPEAWARLRAQALDTHYPAAVRARRAPRM